MSSRPAASSDSYYYANRLGRIVLLATEEVIGRTALKAMLNLSGQHHFINNYPPNNLDRGFSFTELSAIINALERMYGPQASRSLGMRIGRAAFRYGLKEFGASLGVADLAFRLLPFGIKLKIGVESVFGVFNKFSDQTGHIEETEETMLWHVERCPICWGRSVGRPVGFMATGALQEGLFWVSGGKDFEVSEITCIAQGDARGTFVIQKRPLEQTDLP